jgi:hypothetical protein
MIELFVGVRSVFAVPLESLRDEAFSTGEHKFLTQCGGLPIGTTHCGAEVMLSLLSAL